MHDANGVKLNVGDKVMILAEITHLDHGEDYCNVGVASTLGRRPDGNKETISAINTGVLIKIASKSVLVLMLCLACGCYSVAGWVEKGADPTPEQLTAMQGMTPAERSVVISSMKSRASLASMDIAEKVKRTYELTKVRNPVTGQVETKFKVTADHEGQPEIIEATGKAGAQIGAAVAGALAGRPTALAKSNPFPAAGPIATAPAPGPTSPDVPYSAGGTFGFTPDGWPNFSGDLNDPLGIATKAPGSPLSVDQAAWIRKHGGADPRR